MEDVNRNIKVRGGVLVRVGCPSMLHVEDYKLSKAKFSKIYPGTPAMSIMAPVLCVELEITKKRLGSPYYMHVRTCNLHVAYHKYMYVSTCI